MGLLVLTNGRAASAATIAVDASKQTAGNPHFWSAAFGTGRAVLSLRSDWQTHIKIGNRELGAQRLRGHGLTSDDGTNNEMGLYNGGTYNWKNLDTYLTAITSAGMRPIIETDFMPTALGSSGATSPPKDYNAWKSYITALVQHCVDKYGKDDVGTWYFEIWNEPNYPGFWNNSDMNAYYTLYDNTVAAITAVLPNALVGGPAATDTEPISAFLAHCKSAGTRVTFLSSHNYPGGGATGTTADAANLVSDNNTRISAITGNGYTTSAVKSFNTEWNSSYSGQGSQVGDATNSMDNHWNVGFILKAAKLLSDKNSGDTPAIEVFSYWVLTDVFDEDGGTTGIHMTSVNNGNTPFGQVFGVMTFQGMRKAAFNAFKMLNYTGTKRLQSSGGTGSDGIDAMATTSDSGDSLQILVYNYYKTLNTASGSGDSVTVNVSNLPSALANQKVYVTQFLVDETHSNPYSVWSTQGKPGSPSETQWQAMRAAQHLALAQPVSQTSVTTSFTTTFSLSKQAGTLIIVSLKRPLTGRNALVEIEGEDFDGQSGATKEDSGDSTTLGQSISLTSGGYVYFENVDYTDNGVSSVQLRVKSGADTTLELHQDTQTGTLLGKCTVSSTSNAWATQTCTLSQAVTGVSKLYVVAGGALHLNFMKFQSGTNPPPTGGTTGAGGTTGPGGAGGASSGAGGSAAGGSGGSATGGSGGTGRGGATGGTGGATGGTSATTARGGASGGAGGASGGAGGNASGGAGGNASGGAGGNASGGAGGNASGGAGGNASGGAGGNASGGSGGNASGGSGGNASGGSGGNSGSGGSTTNGGATSGCSCRIGNQGGQSGTLLLVGLVAAVLGLRRQRARRCR
jgi:xylan 1,4-beta-xylosidase